MKKVSLLIAMMVLVSLNTFAQFSYDFTGCPEGAKVAQTLGMPWTTWSDHPGSSEDGVFGAVNGDMAAHFTNGVDQVVAFGEKTTGVYDIEFDVYIEENKIGYFNLMHHFPCNSDQAIQIYLQCTNDGSSNSTTMSNGHGTAHCGSNSSFDIPCRWDDWMHFRIHVDLDTDAAEFYFDGELMHTWQWSLNSFGEEGYSDRTLGGIDFYPPGTSNSAFYVDNVVFTPQGGEQELIGESFEEYPVDGKIAQSAIAAGHDWWTTWSNTPGGNNDGTVSDAYASEGSNSGYFTNSTDQVLLLGNYETGVYDFSFDIYTPAGKDGYFNILHVFPASDNADWAMQAYFNAESDETNNESWHSTGHGSVHAGGGLVADLPCVEDEWMNVRVNIDCDNDQATLYFNGEEIYTWQWSLGSFGDPATRILAGANFYGPLATSQFYVDNIHFTKIGGESAPELSVDPEEVAVELEEDDITTVDIEIINDGNSIGDWAGWLDFGEGGAGSQTADLYYHNGDVDNSTGIGSQTGAYTREIGIRLPATAYAGAAMGMKIFSAKFYVNSYVSTDNNYIFRVYGQGSNNQPGELLAEKTVTTTTSMDWITANFDETIYLTGQVYWVTVQMEQAENEFPLTMDGGEYGEESDGNWLSTDGGNFYHCYSADNFGGAWMITANCEGELIPATWATVDKTEGTILGGQSETITLSINSIGLPMDTDYAANLIINTNDEENPQFIIPVILAVTNDVEENVAQQLASIYPNPASSQVTLEGENLNSVAIYNVAGQLVRIVKLNNMVNTIDMNVEAGVYFFSIYDNAGNNSVQRVVIVK